MLAGDVRPIHVLATIVDLAVRGYLRVEDERGDWLLVRTTPDLGPGSVVPDRRAGLLHHERTLLQGVFHQQTVARLAELGEIAGGTLDRVYRQLARDAMILGRVVPGPDPGSARPDDTLARVRDFRTYLGDFDPARHRDPWRSYREYLPYAIAFDLTPGWADPFRCLAPPARLSHSWYRNSSGVSVCPAESFAMAADSFEFPASPDGTERVGRRHRR